MSDRPSWWKRHYLLDEYGDDSPHANHQSSPHLQPLPTHRRNRNPPTVDLDLHEDPSDPETKHRMQRIETFRGIVDRATSNDELANKLTGSTFHTEELLHPNLWFEETQPTQVGDTEFDSFTLNKYRHVYMNFKKPPEPEFSKDEILAMRLAREARDMNKGMARVYDQKRQQTLTKEEQIAENSRLIAQLKHKIEDEERSARLFEQSFSQANEDVLNKLDLLRREERYINNKLLVEHEKPKLYLPDSLVVPLETSPRHDAPDPVWRRTRYLLQTQEDLDRQARYHRALHALTWR